MGATGGTGRLIVRDALAKGHSVVALVRSKADYEQHRPTTTTRARGSVKFHYDNRDAAIKRPRSVFGHRRGGENVNARGGHYD